MRRPDVPQGTQNAPTGPSISSLGGQQSSTTSNTMQLDSSNQSISTPNRQSKNTPASSSSIDAEGFGSTETRSRAVRRTPSSRVQDNTKEGLVVDSTTKKMEASMPKSRRSWLLLALASGGFAALNGVFAKLTTTSLTSSLASTLHNILPFLPPAATEALTRGFFFILNLISNGIMWALFTRALTAHSSTTQVSIINTSANFMVTAFLGAAIFAEKLPGLWFLGAGCLVVGNVIIGRHKTEDKPVTGEQEHRRSGEGLELEGEVKEEEEDVPLLGDLR